MRKAAPFYLLIVGTSILAILGLLHLGKRLTPTGAPAQLESSAAPEPAGPLESLGRNLWSNTQTPLAHLLVQLLVIVSAARLLGRVFEKLHQPAVIGEIVAGVLLGPSLLGVVAPGLFAGLFPPASLGTLKLLAEVGVLVFMFVVGLELDLAHVRSRAHAAVVVSHASIVVPYALGVLLSMALYRSLAPAGVPFESFALFMGIAMSITAFPVLARILEERGLTKTPLGSTAITCAAVDDVTAWSLLAMVVALVRATGVGAAVGTLLLAVGFIALMLRGVRPALGRLLGPRLDDDRPSKLVIGGVLLVVMASAFATETIGIHALFGAFLAGLVMPVHAEFRERLTQRLESFSAVFLLPLFFAFTGLRTQIGLLDDWRSWGICLAVIAVATLGKLGGSMVAARWAGMTWSDSFALGALMNTRGLMELIALNVGYELGILSPALFSMMVVMAIVTTFLTGPLLSLARRFGRAEDTAVDPSRDQALSKALP
jgi:Kef-type K+ transport system membrane component KefB